MSCLANTMLRMAYVSTSGWNWSNREGWAVGLVGAWLSFGAHLCCERHYFFIVFVFSFRNGACVIEREVVVGGRFRASRMLRLEWLARQLAWLLELVALGTRLPLELQ